MKRQFTTHHSPLTLFLLVLLLAVAMPTTVQAKNTKKTKMYMFGFSASFKDSVIYMTDVQEVNDVWYNTKDKFLIGRDLYSQQLKNYLSTTLQQPNRVCVVIFATERKTAEKKFIKMRTQYTSAKSKKKYDIRYLNSSEFKFQAIKLDDEE